MTHRRTLVPALLAASLALTACGNGDDETSTTAAPAPEET
ncbi:ABC transporter substrate-binding protein, partial [Corynebacterium gottingense]